MAHKLLRTRTYESVPHQQTMAAFESALSVGDFSFLNLSDAVTSVVHVTEAFLSTKTIVMG